MICCTLGAAAVATLAGRHRSSASALRLAPAVALPVIALIIAGFAAWHLEHYMARAQAGDRTLLAEFLAAPLCTGGLAKGG